MATAYEKVQLARGKGRPSGLSFIQNIFPDFIELHGDRRFADDPAVIGGIATLGGRAVTVIAIEKGADTKDKVYRNFGSPNPEGYRKALRLMKQAEKFHRPVICFVDTSGAFCGIGAEERGQGQAIADALIVDLLTAPGDQLRACGKSSNDDHSGKDACCAGRVLQGAHVAHHEVVAQTHHQRNATADIARDLLHFLLTVRFLGHVFQGRDSNGKQLHDNGCVDIGCHT